MTNPKFLLIKLWLPKENPIPRKIRVRTITKTTGIIGINKSLLSLFNRFQLSLRSCFVWEKTPFMLEHMFEG